MNKKPRLIVFASGTKDGGGSGFEHLVENSRAGVLRAEIVAVVSNHEFGGIRQKADRLGVPFVYFPEPWDEQGYKTIIRNYEADFVALSGWLKMVKGQDPAKTFNIHPAPLPRFGGKGMYGIHVHEAVIEAFKRGEITRTAVSMHFVTEKYDEGPVFFEFPIEIRKDDTPETLQKRVLEYEHGWQSFITDLVVNDEISWDGRNPDSLKVPSWYTFRKTKTT